MKRKKSKIEIFLLIIFTILLVVSGFIFYLLNQMPFYRISAGINVSNVEIGGLTLDIVERKDAKDSIFIQINAHADSEKNRTNQPYPAFILTALKTNFPFENEIETYYVDSVTNRRGIINRSTFPARADDPYIFPVPGNAVYYNKDSVCVREYETEDNIITKYYATQNDYFMNRANLGNPESPNSPELRLKQIYTGEFFSFRMGERVYDIRFSLTSDGEVYEKNPTVAIQFKQQVFMDYIHSEPAADYQKSGTLIYNDPEKISKIINSGLRIHTYNTARKQQTQGWLLIFSLGIGALISTCITLLVDLLKNGKEGKDMENKKEVETASAAE